MLRLLKYKRVLEQFKDLGLDRVFSNNLGDALGISSALVRKDFSRMNFSGNRRGGYSIKKLIDGFNKILGTEEQKDVVIVGCGNLGKALMNHRPFQNEGIRIAAGFDIDPKETDINEITVYPMEVFENFVEEYNIKVGIISVPSSAAARIRDIMTQSGITAILNFAPVELKSTEDCIIHNVNIGLELENLFFQINIKEEIPDDEDSK